MRCLYEVLGVEKTADDDAIKKAYRKQALVWHPDKNQHRLEEADAHFKEIQNAYEVLSDKHERAWYDSHRDQILRSGERHQAGGGPGGFTPGERPEDEVDLFQYFSSSCYSGFGDGPKGFYGVYSELFSTLAEQEKSAWEASEAAGAKNATAPVFPGFGTSQSAAPEVFAFYNHWASFVTYKDFAWADPYNPAAAPNRQVRRRMEDENRKARRTQRREYLDNVRELVAFVKKRDKRVAKFQAEEAARRAEQQAAEVARRQAEREERLRRAAEYQEPEWARQSNTAAEDEEATSSEPEEVEQHYCIVCEKKFKSEGQLANHERSKAHREALAALKEMLQDEEAWLLDEGAGADAWKQQQLQQQQSHQQQEQQHPVGDNSGSRGKRGKKNKRAQPHQQQQQQQQSTRVERSQEGLQDHQQQPQQQQGRQPEQLDYKQQRHCDSDASIVHDPQELEEDASLAQTAPQETRRSKARHYQLQRRRQQQQQQVVDTDEDATDSELFEDDASLDEDEMLARLVSQCRGKNKSAAAAAAVGGSDLEDEILHEDTRRSEESEEALEGEPNSHNRNSTSSSDVEDEGGSQCEGGGDEEEAAMLARLAAATAATSSSRSNGRLKQQEQQQYDQVAAGLDDLDLQSWKSNKPGKKKRGKSASAAAAKPPAPTAAAAAAGDDGGGSSSGEGDDGPVRGRGSKRAAKQDKRQQRQQKKVQAEAAAVGLLCKVCGETFDSRSKLFKHISSTGHAALKA